MTSEVKDASVALNALYEGRWIYWAPGDHTKYRVMLVQALGPREENPRHAVHALVVQVADGRYRQDSLVINEPEHEGDSWSPRQWVDRHYPPGWWAGIRPLLGALRWTEPEYNDPVFHGSDAAVFV